MLFGKGEISLKWDTGRSKAHSKICCIGVREEIVNVFAFALFLLVLAENFKAWEVEALALKYLKEKKRLENADH